MDKPAQRQVPLTLLELKLLLRGLMHCPAQQEELLPKSLLASQIQAEIKILEKDNDTIPAILAALTKTIGYRALIHPADPSPPGSTPNPTKPLQFFSPYREQCEAWIKAQGEVVLGKAQSVELWEQVERRLEIS